MSSYFGKYRGTVVKNVDDKRLGRLQVKVPNVLGPTDVCWAMPCLPYAGRNVGWFAVPPENAHVWVEFENGEIDHPIWSGCYYEEGESPVPSSEKQADVKILKTEKVTITIHDQKASLVIEVQQSGGSLLLTMDSSGIELKNGKQTVKLAQMSVSVNDGALEVK